MSDGSIIILDDTVTPITVTVEEAVVSTEQQEVDLILMETVGLRGTVSDEVGDARYTHAQSVASTEWNVVHGLGKHPSVTVVDSSNRVVEGELEYLDTFTVRLTFSSAFSGFAYFN
jgi:hypothetical protein